MPVTPFRAALALAATLGAVACSRATGGDAPAAVGVAPDPPNACAKDLTPGDLAEILGPSGVTVKAIPSDVGACAFDGPGHSGVTVSLRSGDEIEPFWRLTIDASGARMTPLAGVGEAALRTPQGGTVLARQGALSCQVDLVGLKAALHQKGIDGSRDLLARKLGALCAKVFAARRA